MTAATLRKEEALGLGVAVALHVALVAALLLQPAPGNPPKMPERMTVSLAEDVGLTAQAPEPVAESRASIAPTLAEQPSPPVPAAIPEPIPAPRPVQTTAPAPRPTPTARPTTRPTPRATTRPRPTASPTARPTAKPTTRPSPRPSATATRAPAPRPTAAPTRSGGQRIGDDFLGGAGSSTTTTETRIPASQIGASAKASIVQSIARQVRPHWQGKAPSGADAELLVTVIAFELNPDGSLKGTPRVVSQSGETPGNRAQKARHAEVAIRAVQLAAPFDLPPEYYNAWKSITGARFDRNLSQ